jgi:2-aminoadipate transaminase
MLPSLQLDEHSGTPLYRQLYEQISLCIKSGSLGNGERLPATRELAGHLGLNRTTVSAAYTLLEESGLIRGHVGRGSFVDYEVATNAGKTHVAGERISFASSRPAEELFPIAEFQTTCQEVIFSPHAATILQLGSPAGYTPLRQHLLEEARQAGDAGPDDDVLITNGCQQALDLLQRSLIAPGEVVAVEDPVYHGLKNVFTRGGARLLGVPMGPDGIDTVELTRVLANARPRLLVVTPSFQNPTGATLPLSARHDVIRIAREFGTAIVENNIYGDLRYAGEALPTLKSLDPASGVILLRSFSKIAFPGLRVGWVIAPRAIITKLADTKQWSDLHTDQLSQAILLRFAQSGRLAAHKDRVRAAGAGRLRAVLEACEKYLPAGTQYTRPQGGMSLWVRLPQPLDASELLPRVQRENVDYLPGKMFSIGNHDPGSLRISFGGLPPDRIELGMAILGKVFSEELTRVRTADQFAAAPAMV